MRIEDPKQLKLKDAFRNDLNSNKDPISLFKEYGTHFLREYIVGGRLDFSSTTDMTTFKSTMGVAASAKASYSVLVGSVSVTSNN